MESSPPLHHFLQLIFLVVSLTTVSAIPFNTTRLRGKQFGSLEDVSKAHPDDFETFYYPQTLDHFNYRQESYQTFQQRCIVVQRYWEGADGSKIAPIFAYLGDEHSLDSRLGFLTEFAVQFKALLVYMEHRYYGKSLPFGDETFKDSNTLGYLNSAQALADYAEILIHIKKSKNALESPIIVIGGGSYGGLLAAWFRLKYPHIAIGALASSAPILYFDDLQLQDKVISAISDIYKEVSENCYETIKRSWSEIDKAASSIGLTRLSNKFKTCRELRHSSELKLFLESMYMNAAQFGQVLVRKMCEGIDETPNGDGDSLNKIVAAVVAASTDATTCYVNPPKSAINALKWQRCSELMMPKGQEKSETMFEPNQRDLIDKECQSLYGVNPRTHWITTYYGGHNMRLILESFGSNIIFYNGLKDPYSNGGVLEDISSTIHAVKMKEGVYCDDIFPTANIGSEVLAPLRKTEFKIIQGWITDYNKKSKSSKN